MRTLSDVLWRIPDSELEPDEQALLDLHSQVAAVIRDAAKTVWPNRMFAGDAADTAAEKLIEAGLVVRREST